MHSLVLLARQGSETGGVRAPPSYKDRVRPVADQQSDQYQGACSDQISMPPTAERSKPSAVDVLGLSEALETRWWSHIGVAGGVGHTMSRRAYASKRRRTTHDAASVRVSRACSDASGST